MGGTSNVLQSLGLKGGQRASVEAKDYNPTLDQLNRRASIWTDPNVAQGMKDYFTGKSSQEEALNVGGNFIPAAYFNALATSALTGSKWATDEVQNNKILGQLFGKDGQLEQQVQREQDLQNQGFKLTPEDVEAYGQASGNVSRLYGQQENALAQALANRGLSAAPSGAAGAGYSGLMGNKNEQLARAQLSIADSRMQNTLQRLSQTQNYISALGEQAANAINQQYGRQLAGAENEMNDLRGTAGLQTQQNATTNQANLLAADFNAMNRNRTLLDSMGAGLHQGAQELGKDIVPSSAQYARVGQNASSGTQGFMSMMGGGMGGGGASSGLMGGMMGA